MCQDCNPRTNMSAKLQLGTALAAAAIAIDRIDSTVPYVRANAIDEKAGAALAQRIRYHVRTIKNYLLECERARDALGLRLEDH